VSDLPPRRLTYTEGNFRAWCEGRKTQTRRVATTINRVAEGHRGVKIRRKDGVFYLTRWPMTWEYHIAPKRRWLERFEFRARYGPVGTPLYVAEPFRVVEGVEAGLVVDRIPNSIGGGLVRVEYAWSRRREWTGVPASHWDTPTAQPSDTFHSSRFFPRWAAHRWSRLEGVRVQFLRDISLDDCLAEGICSVCDHDGTVYPDSPYEPPLVCGGRGGIGCDRYVDLRDMFAEQMWDPINARRGYSWAGAGSEWPGYVWALTVAGPGEEAESDG